MESLNQIKKDISNQETSLQQCTVNEQSDITCAENFDPSLQKIPIQGPSSSTTNFQYHAMTSFQSNVAQNPVADKIKWNNNGQPIAQRNNFIPQQMQQFPSTQMFSKKKSGATGYPVPCSQFIPPNYNSSYFYPTQPQQVSTRHFPYNNIYPNSYKPQMQSAQSNSTKLMFEPPPIDRPLVELLKRQHASSNNLERSASLDNLERPKTPYDLERPVSPYDLQRSKSSHDLECPQSQYNLEQSTLSNSIDKPFEENTEQLFPYKTDVTVTSFSNDSYPNYTNNTETDSSSNFEFEIQQEQYINSLCDEIEKNYFQRLTPMNIINADNMINEIPSFCSPKISKEYEEIDILSMADDDLTNFIVDGCLKAEAIATRNQHRPCFKNIKHLCTRARTDVLKPKTTLANIHSQGIPWATKDFIFAYVRLVNCWFILKGYLDNYVGRLGKIDSALKPEFKNCYQRWQQLNKEMVHHLVSIFEQLDTGFTVQNSEFFSSPNDTNTKNKEEFFSSTLPRDNYNTETRKVPDIYKPCTTKFSSKRDIQNRKQQGPVSNNDSNFVETKKCNVNNSLCNIDEIVEKLQSCGDKNVNIPGILRVKEFSSNTVTSQSNLNNKANKKDKYEHNKIYMKPGSYFVPKKINNSLCYTTNNDNKNKSFGNAQDLQENCNSLFYNLDTKLETLITDSQSTNSQLTNLQPTNLQSINLESTDSQSTNSQSTNSQSTNSQSTYLQSINLESTDSQSTNSQSTDSQSTNLQSTSSQSTNLQSPNSLDRDVVWKNALESIGPLTETLKDAKSFFSIPASSKYSIDDFTIKRYEALYNAKASTTLKNSEDNQALVNYHYFENYIDNNDKETLDTKSTKLDKRTPSQLAFKNNAFYGRKYRRQSYNDMKNQKEDQSKKTDYNEIVPSMYFLSQCHHTNFAKTVVDKFEKIICALWKLRYSKLITYEVDAENMPDYFKLVKKPMFLYKIMNNLKKKKYVHLFQIVHDLRSIVRNSEKYTKKRPIRWIETCALEFATVLEMQLAQQFASVDFSSVTGDPLHPPRVE